MRTMSDPWVALGVVHWRFDPQKDAAIAAELAFDVGAQNLQLGQLIERMAVNPDIDPERVERFIELRNLDGRVHARALVAGRPIAVLDGAERRGPGGRRRHRRTLSQATGRTRSCARSPSSSSRSGSVAIASSTRWSPLRCVTHE